jgi:lipoteichoic acid synthase
MTALLRTARASSLPILLVVLFVIQNLIFIAWVQLLPDPAPGLFLAGTIALGALLYMPAVLLGGWSRYAYLLIASAVVSAIFISQYIYFSLYGGFLQASALQYAGQLNAEWSTVFTLLTPRLLVFTLNVLIVIVAVIVAYRKEHWAAKLSAQEKIMASVVAIVLIAGGYGLLLKSSGDGWQELMHPTLTFRDLNSFTYSPDQTVQEVGISNYYLGDVIGMLLRATPVSQSNVQFVQNWLAQKPAVSTGPYFGIARGDNLIYVQVESLESAVIGQKIGNQEITPNLDALAAQGLYFDNYYTQVGPGNTADAEFVTLNSLYPLTNTVAFIDFANNTYSALPALLFQNGYHTYALHGDVADFWNRENIYPKLGYQEQISQDDFTAHETGFPTLDDDDFLSESAQMMAEFKQPFMATVITLSSHTPFIIPAQYQTLQFPADSTLTERQKDYLQSVHYTDAALGAFIADLKAEGLYNNSVIAIFGDHGSSTGISTALGSTPTTPAALDNSQVPLILLNPKLNASLSGAISTPGSHLDLYPTVANLLGITPPDTVIGQDLLSTKTPVITHRDPYSAIITTILTPTMEYQAAQSGVFADGTCLQLPASTTLPINDCKALYDQQSDNIASSDFIVRGNLIPDLATSTKE